MGAVRPKHQGTHVLVFAQVVNFYNDVSSSIADCHKRMLLEQAKSFEAVILNPTDASGNPIKWDTTHALDGYLRRLSTAMSDFRARHERIKNLHRLLEGRVRALAEADLVKNRAVWSATVRRMQADLKSVEGEFDAKAQQPWRLHWDMQLKKTLALLYRRGLATYHQSLPPTEIRLLFQQRRLQFDPPLEQIRQDHIRALASFVELPATTGGLSAYAKEGTGFFASVAHGPEIAGLVGAVYEQAEAIFNELGKERTTLSDWVAVGMVPDVEAFVDEQCRDFADVSGRGIA